MKNIEKKYVRTVDASRILTIYTLSLVVGICLFNLGLSWPICFAIMMIFSGGLCVATEKIIKEKLEERYLLSASRWFFWLSILLDIILFVYLIYNRDFATMAVVACIYVFILIYKRKKRKERL